MKDNLIEEVERYRGAGRSWKDHSLAWAQVQDSTTIQHQLEEILAAMGENGERRIDWNFDPTPCTPPVIVESELGTGETPKVAWELRIRRELEEEGDNRLHQWVRSR